MALRNEVLNSRASIPLVFELSQDHGDRLISHSQAKRVVANLEKFTDVTFDFKRITRVGQSFVDQLFSSFQQQHP